MFTVHPMKRDVQKKAKLSKQSSLQLEEAEQCAWMRRNTRSVCFQAWWQACRCTWSWRWGEFAFVVPLKWSLHDDTIQVLTELVILCFQNIINSGQPFHFFKKCSSRRDRSVIKVHGPALYPSPQNSYKNKVECSWNLSTGEAGMCRSRGLVASLA